MRRHVLKGRTRPSRPDVPHKVRANNLHLNLVMRACAHHHDRLGTGMRQPQARVTTRVLWRAQVPSSFCFLRNVFCPTFVMSSL